MRDEDLLELYERTIDDLFRYASRLTGGDRPMAEELVQDTYLAVLRRIRAGDVVAVDIGWLIVSCRHRTALVLRYVDDLPVREVARAMRRSEHATESLLARARASLRAALTPEVS
jgi:RNA polymerase sigma-70 factor (ECF subfamily)